MNVAPEEHFAETLFESRLEAALRVPLPRISKGAKEHVPQRQVRIVERVNAFFVMDAVAFRPLEQKAQPIRRAHIPVINEFGEPAQQDRSRGSLWSNSYDKIEDGAGECAVRQDFERMLVEAGDDLDPLWTVMEKS